MHDGSFRVQHETASYHRLRNNSAETQFILMRGALNQEPQIQDQPSNAIPSMPVLRGFKTEVRVAQSRAQLSIFLSMQVPETMIPAPIQWQALERPHSSSISCGNPNSRSICSQNLIKWSKVTYEKYPIITTPNPASKALIPSADFSSTSSKDTTDQKFVIPQNEPILPLTRTC